MSAQNATTERKSMARILWQSTRPHTLTASFVPVLIGTVLAMSYVHVSIGLFVAMLASCLLIQVATNLFNEYYDFKRGLDTEHSIGIGGTIVRDGLLPKTVLRLALGSYAVAILIGVYICSNSSWWLALIGLVGMLVGYLYTGGPIPIAYTPLGELCSGLFMGAMFILISFFIQTGTTNTKCLLICVPVALLVGAINLSNNIRDLDGDKASGRKTLAILVGHNRAIYILGITFAIAYAWTIGLVIMGEATPWILVVFMSVSKPIKAVNGFVGKRLPLHMMPAMKATAQTNTFFGLLLSIGLFIGYQVH